jgi:hypothetical protein
MLELLKNNPRLGFQNLLLARSHDKELPSKFAYNTEDLGESYSLQGPQTISKIARPAFLKTGEPLKPYSSSGFNGI